MSGHGSFPPPGALPGAAPSSAPPLVPPPPGPPLAGGHWHRAAHKPGAVPLRPLGVGDMYDATFKIIRFNPRATVGSAVLVASLAMALPLVVTGALTTVLDLTFDPGASEADVSGEQLAGLLGSFGSLLLGMVLMSFGMIFVTGMIAHVVMAATLGRLLSLGEAWAATEGKRWRLVGLAGLLFVATSAILVVYGLTWVPVVMAFEVWAAVVYGFVTVPLLIAGMFWFWVRVAYLPAAVLMLEDVGVLGAIGRGFALVGRHFWRTFGIALLTYVIAQIAGSMLAMPFSLVAQFAPVLAGTGATLVLVMVGFTALGTVVSAAFVAPFTTTVAVLQYVDLRMRKEAFDVELMTRAGLPAPTRPEAHQR
ncbi:hypothetical protein [Nocardioides sp.]|uniref:hypothetical protein n=1 Tax=Nocardioides sp. TaxID=35761 RepID=UPI0027323E0E|nr:hypothetical protein [Nocardioides sp.]MDP3892032.1 hypothetical protein [Nocardioides sp.]